MDQIPTLSPRYHTETLCTGNGRRSPTGTFSSEKVAIRTVAQSDLGVTRILESERLDGLEYSEATLLHVHRYPVNSNRPYRRRNFECNREM